LDEAHFILKDMHAKYAWKEVGEKVIVFTNASFKVSYSLTVLT
jgi:hypothetical protein